jgi:DNA replication protein DnaC
MKIIEDRYMSGSTIIASQLPNNDWHAFIGDQTIADAVRDRLFHIAHKFELKGGSIRKKTEMVD